MAKSGTVDELLAAHGTTFCDELGIAIEKNTPSPLFRWLIACILYANPIQHHLAAQAAKALAKAGLRTSKAMAEASWQKRAEVLGWNGYGQYSERTATILKDAADLIEADYKGDLRRLRQASDGDQDDMRRRLKAVKGMGDVAVNIFFREVQDAWEELYPYADRLALKEAKRRGLGDDARALARLVPRQDYARLVAALTRASLSDG